MKSSHLNLFILLIAFLLATSCSNNEDEFDNENTDATFLKFTTATSQNQNGTVLYSDWIKTEFSAASNFGSEQWNLPYIPNELLDLDKDLVLIFAKRNHLFQLPTTTPTSYEHYTTDFGKYPKGVLASIRVYAYNWQTEPLDDIFFGTHTNAMFRVMIIPGEKMFNLGSTNLNMIEHFSYEALTKTYQIPD